MAGGCREEGHGAPCGCTIPSRHHGNWYMFLWFVTHWSVNINDHVYAVRAIVIGVRIESEIINYIQHGARLVRSSESPRHIVINIQRHYLA